MSKQRAHRRALRLAEVERERAARERVRARRLRRARRRAAIAHRLARRGRTGRMFARRSAVERVGIALAAGVVIAAIWLEFDGLATQIALTALVLVALPALIVLALDRRT